jgi:hypothetical protein
MWPRACQAPVKTERRAQGSKASFGLLCRWGWPAPGILGPRACREAGHACSCCILPQRARLDGRHYNIIATLVVI